MTHPVLKDRKRAMFAIVKATTLYCVRDLDNLPNARIIELYDTFVFDRHPMPLFKLGDQVDVAVNANGKRLPLGDWDSGSVGSVRCHAAGNLYTVKLNDGSFVSCEEDDLRHSDT